MCSSSSSDEHDDDDDDNDNDNSDNDGGAREEKNGKKENIDILHIVDHHSKFPCQIMI